MKTGYRQSFIDILENFINGMQFQCQIWNVQNNTPVTGQYTLSVDNVYHAVAGYTVTIGGKPYTIVSWIDTPNAQRLVVSDPGGSGVIAPQQTFNFYTPYFFHGTPLDATTEIKQEKSEFNKSPMIWLWENYEETYHDDPEDAIERDVEASLYFLTITANSMKLQTDDLDYNYVRPMRRLLDNFIHSINNPIGILQRWDTKYKTQVYYKFGVIARNKGVSENLMVDKLTGVELKMTFKIIRSEYDNCEMYITSID